ncbi:5-methylcytosine-specific restriction enzyme A [Desulfonispora thiosulfatigenes DSM 11270]|uniref:5-methylcytosine-specific restriction enzyme A n=1 Tax=Desulfonispora thiosulfatigenes DSM 11270 TaxID=656914 RepID=A0A1W1V926_DESTI|nr:HNH endonuclease [Desulfonispora thiosulfatigenes]SMB89949.1 5-methylcytosine-specific restriction enzyme A [Desulfonispora thiosulfatigenes DSM 11270]
MNWLISANGSIYRHSDAFEKMGYVDWRQTANYEVGDIIYIYSTRPLSKIEFKCIVEKIDIQFKDITDDKEFWINEDEYYKWKKRLYSRIRLIERTAGGNLTLNKLKENGLKAAPQGPIKLKDDILSYIEKYFHKDLTDITFPDEIPNEEGLYEGVGVSVKVSRYERSSIARKKCIEYHGSDCIVCGFSFGKVYGDFAEGFIHVHHVTPLSEINAEYKVDYKNDLIPVCPNCHAMLHKKKGSEYLSIEQLKEIIKRK